MSAPLGNCPHCGAYDWIMQDADVWGCAVCGTTGDEKRRPSTAATEQTGTELSKSAHQVALSELERLMTDEHRRRVRVFQKAVKGLPMQRRVVLARTFLLDGVRTPNRQWNGLVREFMAKRRANPLWGVEVKPQEPVEDARNA